MTGNVKPTESDTQQILYLSDESKDKEVEDEEEAEAIAEPLMLSS